jgi:putative serine protease PepD
MTEWNPENDEPTRRLPGADGATGGPADPAGARGDDGRPDASGGTPGGSQHRYGEQRSAPAGAGSATPPGPGSSTAAGPAWSPYGPPPGDTEHTRIGGFGFRSEDDPHAAGPQRRSRLGGGLVAGLLAGALVVGGLAGLAGAAGYQALDDDSSSSTTTSSAGTNGSPIIDRKSGAPATSTVEAVAKSVLPSVVKINVTSSQEQGSGSGIVISSDGEILTNNHVAAVGEGGSITVNFNDGSAKKARIVGTDPVTDLAVIKAEGVSGLHPATVATSGPIAVGENVVAIGSPFGLEATVTSGIVSALNRPVSVQTSDSQQSPLDPFGDQGGSGSQSSQPDDTTYPAIQTDAAINPGNSGGPLVDMNGAVIGINSSIRTASDASAQGGSIGLGFAIPIENVWPVVQQLRNGEKPTHAQMGVSVTDATSQNGLLTGAGIQAVNSGSAAEKAGVRKGDVVTKVGDQVVSGSEALVATVRGHRPGDKVTLTVVRGGKTRSIDVTLDSDAKAS